LTIGNGMVVMANPDDKGQAELTADTDGEGFVRIDGQYLAEALKACGGMVDFKLTNATSPMLFTVDGYKLVVMPMLTTEANEQAKAEREAEAEQAEPDEELAEALAESIAVNEQAEQPTTAWGEAEKRAKVVSEELAKAEQSEPTKPVAEKPKGKRSRAKEPVAVAK
jgi:DNA polymerase-3 subunit beta